jgi:hypothetical protein
MRVVLSVNQTVGSYSSLEKQIDEVDKRLAMR